MVNRRVAAAIAAAVALVACGGQGPGRADSAAPGSGAVQGRDDALMLRWRMTGGIAGLGGPGTVPDFSLYGDGRALVKRTSRSAYVPLREHRLKPAALRRLLAEARAAGLDRSRTYGSQEPVADAMTLVITMGGATTRVVQPESQRGPAVGFWKKLDPRGWPDSDLAAPPRAYRPERVAVIAGRVRGANGQKITRWPVDRPLGGGERAAGGSCSVYTGARRDAAVKHVTTAGARHLWSSGDGMYSVRLRPMLPDERTCQDVARA